VTKATPMVKAEAVHKSFGRLEVLKGTPLKEARRKYGYHELQRRES